jgi:SAM-dependent methyltransferase
MLQKLTRARRGSQLLGTTRFIVLSNFLRTGVVEFLRSQPEYAAPLDSIVDFYCVNAAPPPAEDIELLLEYYRGAANPNKAEFVRFLIARASWLARDRVKVKFQPPSPEVMDWNPVVRGLHEKFDPQFSGNDPVRRNAAKEHWHNFLNMADAFGIVSYSQGCARLSAAALRKLTRELEIFGDGYYGVDDLLGVLLKVEALRGETNWIVRPPPFMLETCDALARRIGIESYFRFVPRLRAGGCRVLDLGCGSGIYSNAFAERGNKCVAVDMTPWVFYRAFLGARSGVQVECCDMNVMPERVTREPFTHAISNIAAHHFKDRPALFAQLRDRVGEAGEVCVLNFNYSIRQRAGLNPVAKLKRQFAAQIQYNWSVLEHERGGVDFIAPSDVARDLEAAGFSVTVRPCDPLKELWFVHGVKR